MSAKKIVASAVAACVAVGAVAGGIYGYKAYQKSQLVAEVMSVSDLNWGYWGDSATSYGMVTNDSSQEVYLANSKTIKKIYVSEGDTVSEGDPLIEYDTSELAIQVERKKLDLEEINNKIESATHTLEVLQATKPVDKTPPKLETSTIEELTNEDTVQNTVPQTDPSDGRIYNYVTEESVAYNASDRTAGTENNPYIYYCNKNAYVYGSFLNYIRDNEIVVQFIAPVKNSDGTIKFEEVTVNGQDNSTGGSTENGGTENAVSGTESGGTGSGSTESGSTENSGAGDTESDGTENSGTESGGTESGESTESTGSTEANGITSSARIDLMVHVLAAKMYNIASSITQTVTTKRAVSDTSVANNPATFNYRTMPIAYDDFGMWYIFTGAEYVPSSSLADDYMSDFMENVTDWVEPEGYTAEELTEAISEQNKQLKELDISRRQAELELETLNDSASDGILYAKISGEVKSVKDPDNLVQDGTPFMVLSGDDGLYVRGTISELLLGDIHVGMTVSANSWETGQTFDATITEIGDYPVDDSSWGDGNPNVSYYSYIARIDGEESLNNGEYVDLTIDTNMSETGGIYISKAYVRTEDGKSYCMVADENDKLTKRFVVTGKTIYGSAVEIKSGLSEDERIAFPYGKNAVEGASVKDSENYYY